MQITEIRPNTESPVAQVPMLVLALEAKGGAVAGAYCAICESSLHNTENCPYDLG